MFFIIIIICFLSCFYATTFILFTIKYISYFSNLRTFVRKKVMFLTYTDCNFHRHPPPLSVSIKLNINNEDKTVASTVMVLSVSMKKTISSQFPLTRCCFQSSVASSALLTSIVSCSCRVFVCFLLFCLLSFFFFFY